MRLIRLPQEGAWSRSRTSSSHSTDHRSQRASSHWLGEPRCQQSHDQGHLVCAPPPPRVGVAWANCAGTYGCVSDVTGAAGHRVAAGGALGRWLMHLLGCSS